MAHWTPATRMASIPTTSSAARIPQELFDIIVSFVGHEYRLGINSHGRDFDFGLGGSRREEMRYLSSCALTCVRWANLTRERIFHALVLRSPDDLRYLKSLLRSRHDSRIRSIADCLRMLVVFYQLDRYPWFCEVQTLRVHGASRLNHVHLHVSGSVSPRTGSGHTIRHPLFHHAPRALPISLPEDIETYIILEDIHFPNCAMVSGLLRDLDPLRSYDISCYRVTWDEGHGPDTPFSTFIPSFTCSYISPEVSVRGCTDNVFVATLLHDRARRRMLMGKERRPHLFLSTSDSLHLVQIMSTICSEEEKEYDQSRLGSDDNELVVWGEALDTSDTVPDEQFAPTLSGNYSFYLNIRIRRGRYGAGPLLTCFTDHDVSGDAVLRCVLIDIRLWSPDEVQYTERLINAICGLSSLNWIAIQCDDIQTLADFVVEAENTFTPVKGMLRLFCWYEGDENEGHWEEIEYEQLLQLGESSEEENSELEAAM